MEEQASGTQQQLDSQLSAKQQFDSQLSAVTAAKQQLQLELTVLKVMGLERIHIMWGSRVEDPVPLFDINVLDFLGSRSGSGEKFIIVSNKFLWHTYHKTVHGYSHIFLSAVTAEEYKQ